MTWNPESRDLKPMNPREAGVALLLALVLTIGLIGFTALSVEITRTHAAVLASENSVFRARTIADSAVAEALGRLKEAGQSAPVSGDGIAPIWVEFSGGEYYYTTSTDFVNSTSTITAWGRVPLNPNSASVVAMSSSNAIPGDSAWDGSGYAVQGVEVTVVNSRYVPESPVYFGNGGIQRPMGGFDWNNSTDVFDPSTWSPVSYSPHSWQDSNVPLRVSALDHPYDYLVNGGTPTAYAGSGYHDFSPWTSQTAFGQMNLEAFFGNSAGSGNAWNGIEPSVNTSTYDTNPSSPDYVFPLEPNVADVQEYAWDLWTNHSGSATANTLGSGTHSGTYGSLTNPEVTFVTGRLRVNSGQTFEGAGILVIRDDFDPNYDTNNTPSTYARLDVYGTLNWTGLVIIAGWNPYIRVRNNGEMNVVGALMGEDSVMSMGEVSLDSSAIIMTVQDDMNILYSSEMFQPGGLIYDYLPTIDRTVVGSRELFSD